MENKRLYIKPKTELVKAYPVDCVLDARTSPVPHPFEPGAKSNNLWDQEDDNSDIDQYGFHRVGGSHKNLWDDQTAVLK